MLAMSQSLPATPAAARVAWWNDARIRAVIAQVAVLGGVILLVAYLVSNTLANLETRNIATGFGFLQREAGFGISESAIPYNPANTYFRALAVGVFNTLKVAVVGIILATFIGILAGVARLSRNWLVARLATCYVEGLRNIPVLLQLFFWYALITEGLPGPRQALNPPGDLSFGARPQAARAGLADYPRSDAGRLPRCHCRCLGYWPLGEAAPGSLRTGLPDPAG